MSQNTAELRLEDLEIKPHLVIQLKNAGVESIFDLAISVPQQKIGCCACAGIKSEGFNNREIGRENSLD